MSRRSTFRTSATALRPVRRTFALLVVACFPVPSLAQSDQHEKGLAAAESFECLLESSVQMEAGQPDDGDLSNVTTLVSQHSRDAVTLYDSTKRPDLEIPLRHGLLATDAWKHSCRILGELSALRRQCWGELWSEVLKDIARNPRRLPIIRYHIRQPFPEDDGIRAHAWSHIWFVASRKPDFPSLGLLLIAYHGPQLRAKVAACYALARLANSDPTLSRAIASHVLVKELQKPMPSNELLLDGKIAAAEACLHMALEVPRSPIEQILKSHFDGKKRLLFRSTVLLLRLLGTIESPESKELFEEVVENLRSRDPERCAAAAGLLKLGSRGALRVFQTALASRDEVLQWQAADSVPSVRIVELVPLLARNCRSDEPLTREASLLALERIGARDEALTEAERLVRDREGFVQLAASEVIRRSASVENKDILASILDDPQVHPDARLHVADALARVSPETLLPFLDSPLAYVRDRTAIALCRAGHWNSLDRLVQIMRTPLHLYRTEAIHALEKAQDLPLLLELAPDLDMTEMRKMEDVRERIYAACAAISLIDRAFEKLR